MIELERKFLLPVMPMHLKQIGDAYLIHQSYVSTHPNEFRIRRRALLQDPDYYAGISYKSCVKGNGSLARSEIEFHLDVITYHKLLDELNLDPIVKEYYKFELDNDLVLECSIVDRHLPTSFIYAEVEFKTEEEALAFVPPAYLGIEVTYDNDWKMKNYWTRTRLGGRKNE